MGVALAMLAWGSDPPGTPRGADGAWPASRQAPSRMPARGGDPPEPPEGPRSRSSVTRPWPLWMRRSLAAPLAAGVVLTAPSAVSAAVAAGRPAARLTYEVTTTADTHDAHPGDGRCADSSGQCTLRAAVEEAAAQPPHTAVSITLPAGTYPLILGSLDFDGGPVSVAGAGARSAVIEATGGFRVLDVGSAATATLSGVTITGGRAGPGSYGGGVLNTGRLWIINSIVTANRATAGSGIANDGGTAVVTGSTLSGNTAGQSPGGAIANYRPLTLMRDTLTHNRAAYGGALEAAYAGTPGRQLVLDSTLTGNKALTGGAIDDRTDTLYVTASTLAGNSATLGGAIEVEGESFFYLRSSTLTGNFAKSGTGGAIDTYGCGGGVVSYSTIAGNSSGLNLPCSDLVVTGSIIAASAPGPNCAGAAPHESAGYNLDTGVSCAFAKPTDLTAADPQLAPLTANGGPTPTQVPADGSPAINA